MDKRARHSVDDVPVELIHRIQSLLPERQAAQTCVLSKSWLQAWSTIPKLRFSANNILSSIEGTLLRYHKENIPIESFDLRFDKENIPIKRWIQLVASQSSCLQELSLTTSTSGIISSFTLPDVMIFNGENLKKINVSAALQICRNPAVRINCVSLRELRLYDVDTSDDVLHNLFSTCSLLEKVMLGWCKGVKSIKIKNLLCLRELQLFFIHGLDRSEIHNVPSLLLFTYKSLANRHLPFNTDSLGSITQLHLSGVFVDNALLDMIKSKFPFLQSLKLLIYCRGLDKLVITNGSIRMLTLELWWVRKSMDVLVYAPDLVSFFYYGTKKPRNVLFPVIAPKQIKYLLFPDNG